MTITPISLGTRSNPGRAGAISAAQLINCYADDVGEEGKIQYPIMASDSFTAFATIPSGGITRALLSFSDAVAYGVSGTEVIKVTSLGVVTSLGTITTSGTVTMARNRRQPYAQVVIVTSDGQFKVIENDVLTTLTPPSGSTFNSVCSVDGYFILTDSNGEWFVTSIDGTVIDALNFAAAEVNPDGLIIAAVRGRDVCFFGSRSVEFWQNTGNAAFPFERTTSAGIGCYAAGSVCNMTALIGNTPSDTIAWCATDANGAYIGVYLMDGYGGTKISDDAVDRSVRAEGTSTANIRGFSWTISGRTFYALTGSTFTWVYETVTRRWHQRASSGLSRWRIAQGVSFAGKTIVGDYTTGLLYEMSPSVYSSADAVVSLSTSKDNGATFTTARTKTIGGASSLKQRFKFARLGQSKEDGLVMKITVSNAVNENGTGVPMTVIPPHIHAWPNPVRIAMAYVDVVPGSSNTATPKAITGMAVDSYAVKG